MNGGFTFDQILPFILALLLIFIIPMIMRRYGLDPGDFAKKLFSGRLRKELKGGKAPGEEAPKKREPWQSNGRSGDLTNLVSTLLIFARRHKIGLISPGTVSDGHTTANLLAILVTHTEAIGVNCFGYGGTVTERQDGTWNQHMNGADTAIGSPLEANRKQYALVRKVMDEKGLSHVPLRIVAVFTSRGTVLSTRHPREILTTEEFIRQMKERAGLEEGALDPQEVSRKINESVIRMRPSGKGEKKS